MSSRWDSSEANTAVFRSSRTGSSCRTDGFNFLYALSADLHDRILVAGGSLPTFDGVVTDADVLNLAPDEAASGAWTPGLLRVIYAAARSARAPAAYLASVQRDALTGAVSRETLQTAIWLAMYSYGYRNGVQVFDVGSPAEVELPADASIPIMGVSMLRPAIYDITCGIGPMPVANVAPVRTIASSLPVPVWLLTAAIVAGVAAIVVIGRNVPQKPSERRR
jgi:hypothetical protein